MNVPSRGARLQTVMEERKLDAVIVTGIKNTLALSEAAFPDEVWYEMVHGLDPSVLVLVPGAKSFAFSSRPFDHLEGFDVEHLPDEFLYEPSETATEWMDVFTEEQKARANALVPNDLCTRFSWPPSSK